MNIKEKVLIHKGMDKVKQGLYQEAIEVYDRVLSMNPESTYAWNNRGVALFKAGRTQEALECYDQSLKHDPQNLDALRNKAFLLMSTGRLEDALQSYNSVIEAGGDPIDLESKAAVFVGLGRLQEALDCMMEAMQIAPLDRFEEEIAVLRSMIQQAKSQP